jgi:hypothetical protein
MWKKGHIKYNCFAKTSLIGAPLKRRNHVPRIANQKIVYSSHYVTDDSSQNSTISDSDECISNSSVENIIVFSKKKSKPIKNKSKCFGCGGIGHFIAECPTNKKRF